LEINWEVLLGDLGGIAISAVRIAGVKSWIFNYSWCSRRYTWNLIKFKRGLFFKTKADAVWSFKIQGPAVADLIQLPSNLEIVNPNHYITTISTIFWKLNSNLSMELVID
jgi:DNA-directed RNA polymerase alpha subunit